MTLRKGLQKRVPVFMRSTRNRTILFTCSCLFVILDAVLTIVNAYGNVDSYFMDTMAAIYFIIFIFFTIAYILVRELLDKKMYDGLNFIIFSYIVVISRMRFLFSITYRIE